NSGSASSEAIASSFVWTGAWTTGAAGAGGVSRSARLQPATAQHSASAATARRRVGEEATRVDMAVLVRAGGHGKPCVFDQQYGMPGMSCRENKAVAAMLCISRPKYFHTESYSCFSPRNHFFHHGTEIYL